MIEIQLEWYEVQQAVFSGCLRHVQNLSDNKKKPYTSSKDNNAPANTGWQRNCEGALGECALAKWKNLDL